MLDSGIQPGRKKADKIYNWLRAYIDENKFSSNQRLPSENELCRRLDVSRETVRAAMARLVEENLVSREVEPTSIKMPPFPDPPEV